MFRDMISEIRRAEHFIFLEYFIISIGKMWDEMLEALTDRAEHGVEIRIIYDDMGCVALLPPKYFKVLENIFAWGMLFYTVTFLALVIYILNAGGMQVKADQVPENSAFIVYGAGIRDDRPGNVLKKRLNKTIEYMEASPDSICVVSGAQGPSENYTEAYVMKKYLTENGIDESRVLEEDRARNTKQNIKYSVELLEKEGEADRHIISVSNSFHIPRIKLLCSRTGVEGDFVLAKDPMPQWLFSELVREYMAYVKLFLTGTE